MSEIKLDSQSQPGHVEAFATVSEVPDFTGLLKQPTRFGDLVRVGRTLHGGAGYIDLKTLPTFRSAVKIRG